MAQWIRHRPTEPGIAGSSPAGVTVAHYSSRLPRHAISSAPAGWTVLNRMGKLLERYPDSLLERYPDSLLARLQNRPSGCGCRVDRPEPHGQVAV